MSNAPRVVRRIRGDFTADVRVLGQLKPGRAKTTYYAPFHGAGLIVWQDPSNYLRLERAVGFVKGRPHPYVNYDLREGGRLALSYGITIADHSLFLKLRRQGQQFSAWYSRDGRRWVQLASVTPTLDERVEVGVVAVNSSARTLSIELERFGVTDPRGSTARDFADDDSEIPPPPLLWHGEKAHRFVRDRPRDASNSARVKVAHEAPETNEDRTNCTSIVNICDLTRKQA